MCYLSRASADVEVWCSKADANEWHTPGWHTRLDGNYGARSTVVFYDWLVQVDNSRDQVVLRGAA